MTERNNGEQLDVTEPHPRMQRVSQRMPAVAAMLKRADVSYVRITYQGEWDSGRVNDALFHGANGELINPSLPGRARRALWAFFHELLEVRHPGWKNAEGSRGEFEWELVRDELTHVHGWRNYSYDFDSMRGL
ncbi:hypothetical protein [Peristeroidobacter soli]|uniref:hypothetical protein n=1 Tax=Peristeroidobacter soli TaxID=2497877 RepID=UPI00101DCF40|nr:hypothetical protein [Peristeroidobacter soli]